MEAMLEGLAHKPKMPRGMKDMRKHKFHETHIKHNHDGSHTLTLHHMKAQPTTHSASSLEELHDLLEEHLGGKPSAEEMKE